MHFQCSQQQSNTKSRFVQALCIEQNCSRDRNICIDCIRNHENHLMIDIYYLKNILKQEINDNNFYQQLENQVFSQINEIKQNTINSIDQQEEEKIKNILNQIKNDFDIQSLYDQIISPQLTTNDFHLIGVKLSKILYQVVIQEQEIIKVKQLTFDNMKSCENIEQLNIKLQTLFNTLQKVKPVIKIIQNRQSKTEQSLQQSNYKLVHTVPKQTDILSVAISSDVKILATGGLTDLRIWDFNNLQLLKKYPSISYASCILFSQDNTKLIVAGYYQSSDGQFQNDILVLNLKNLELNPIIQCQGHTDSIIRIYASLEFKILISGSIDQTIRIWKSSNGQQITQYAFENEVYGITYTGLYDIIGASFSGGKAMIVEKRDLALGEKQHFWQAHLENTYYIEFIQNGDLIITSGNKSIKVWELGNILNNQYVVDRQFICPLHSPIWMVKTNFLVFPNLMLSCNGKIQVWDYQKQQINQTLEFKDGLIQLLCKNKVLQNGWQFSMSNDGKYMIVGGVEGLKIFVNSP